MCGPDLPPPVGTMLNPYALPSSPPTSFPGFANPVGKILNGFLIVTHTVYYCFVSCLYSIIQLHELDLVRSSGDIKQLLDRP